MYLTKIIDRKPRTGTTLEDRPCRGVGKLREEQPAGLRRRGVILQAALGLVPTGAAIGAAPGSVVPCRG